MACCGSMRDRLLSIQARLKQRGAKKEAERVAHTVGLLDRFFGKKVEVDPSAPEEATEVPARVGKKRAKAIKSVLGKKREAQEKPPHGLPSACAKYYRNCMNNPPSTVKDAPKERREEYCSRVAWQICCQSGKGGAHCGELGLSKKKGPIPGK